MSYNLFLDDTRVPSDVIWIDLPNVKWEIVRNYSEFVNIINERGIPDIVSFDHDLADEHYLEYKPSHDKNSPNFGVIHYDKFKEKTGMDCAKYLANYCVDKNTEIPVYYLHTLNGVGRMNMLSILETARKIIKK